MFAEWVCKGQCGQKHRRGQLVSPREHGGARICGAVNHADPLLPLPASPSSWSKVIEIGEAARVKLKGWPAVMKPEFYSCSMTELSHSGSHVATAEPATRYEGVERSLGTAHNCV